MPAASGAVEAATGRLQVPELSAPAAKGTIVDEAPSAAQPSGAVEAAGGDVPTPATRRPQLSVPSSVGGSTLGSPQPGAAVHFMPDAATATLAAARLSSSDEGAASAGTAEPEREGLQSPQRPRAGSTAATLVPAPAAPAAATALSFESTPSQQQRGSLAAAVEAQGSAAVQSLAEPASDLSGSAFYTEDFEAGPVEVAERADMAAAADPRLPDWQDIAAAGQASARSAEPRRTSPAAVLRAVPGPPSMTRQMWQSQMAAVAATVVARREGSDAGSHASGSVSDEARRPGVHPQKKLRAGNDPLAATAAALLKEISALAPRLGVSVGDAQVWIRGVDRIPSHHQSIPWGWVVGSTLASQLARCGAHRRCSKSSTRRSMRSVLPRRPPPPRPPSLRRRWAVMCAPACPASRQAQGAHAPWQAESRISQLRVDMEDQPWSYSVADPLAVGALI